MAEVKPSPAEALKSGSRHLRGTIAEELANFETAFSRPAAALLKFHGAYQQDDRDLRKTQPEKVYSSMVRVGLPGGVASAQQYLDLDGLADRCGDGTLRITSRQDVQYHGVVKGSLKELLKAIGETGLGTLAACGDVVRNTTCDTTPIAGPEREELVELARRVGRELKPKTRAYAEIWLDGERAASLEAEADSLYGEAYLPRKFKIGFTFPGENLIDIYTNDLGFVPFYEGGVRRGFTVLAGGGMGMSNGIKGSYPRLADVVASIGPSDDEVLEVSRAVVTIHRDFGNRSNRKLARLKYILQERGVEWFKAELESRLGRTLAPPRELAWHRQDDYLGWHRQGSELWFYGLRVVNGRLKGAGRAAVREVVERLGCEVRFTVQQNLLFCGLRPEQKAELDAILARHGVKPAAELPPVLRHSMACVSLPTCGQAITESERVLPDVAAALQAELTAAGLAEQVVHVRMTGCPNGCVRPYTAEIGVVGESVGLYTLYLGGSEFGNRMARVWKRLVPLNDLASTLRPLFVAYAAERQTAESFGDWFDRTQ